MREHNLKSFIFLSFAVSYCYFTNNGVHGTYAATISQEECKVTEPMLLKILEILETAKEAAEFSIEELNQGILSDNLQLIPSVQIPHKSNKLVSCQEIVSSIEQCTVYIEAEVVVLYRAAVVNSTRYHELRGRLGANMDTLQVILGYVRSLLDFEMEELYWTKVAESRDTLFEEVRKRYSEMENISNIETKLLELISTQIMVGNFFDAEENFKMLNNSKLRESITDMVYKKNFLEELAGYVYYLPEHLQRASVLLRWFQKMNETGELVTDKLIIFRKVFLDEEIRMASYFSNDLKDIKDEMDSKYSDLIDVWAGNVLNSTFADIGDTVSPRELSFIGECFDVVIPDIIDKTYSSSANASLMFVLSLHWNKHKATGLERLVTKADSSSQAILKFAHKTKIVMDNLDGPDSPDPVLIRLNNLKAFFNYNVRCLVWHSTIYLRNVDYNLNYLGVYQWFDNDNDNRRLLVNTDGVRYVNSEFDFYYNETNEDGNFYKIHSKFANHYVGQYSTYNSSQYHVSVSREQNSPWIALLSGSTDVHLRYRAGNIFYLSNEWYNAHDRIPLISTTGSGTGTTWRVECV